MKKLPVLAAVGVLIAALTSCSKSNDFVGSWQSMHPTDISRQLPGAANGSALISISFGQNQGQGGDVQLSSIIEATQPLVENPGVNAGYEVSVAATATINGKWTYEHGDDDDLILSLDPTTLDVHVDNSGVTFRQNQIDGAQTPVTDSLTTATANMWKAQITQAMRAEFGRYNKIDDIKVGKDSTLKFELDNPDQTLIFRKI